MGLPPQSGRRPLDRRAADVFDFARDLAGNAAAFPLPSGRLAVGARAEREQPPKVAGGTPNMRDAVPTSSNRKVWSSSVWPTLIALTGSGIARPGGPSNCGGGCKRLASQLNARRMLIKFCTSSVRRHKST
jgi:hypothetical protein